MEIPKLPVQDKNAPRVDRVICLVKASRTDEEPVLLTYFSKDWDMLLLPNVSLAENQPDDEQHVRQLLANRLRVPADTISIRFDRGDAKMRTVCLKKMRDRVRKVHGPDNWAFHHYYCVVTISVPPAYWLRKQFRVGEVTYRWMTLSELKQDEDSIKDNADVIDFIGQRFDSTLGFLPTAFGQKINGADRVFVITALRSDMEAPFEGIEAAAESCGLVARRVVDVKGDYRITDQILSEIRQSVLVVADLTHERPNVYFELGYARGIGRCVVTIAKSGTALHFDVKDWTCIFYSDSRELERALRERFMAELDKIEREKP